MTRHTLQREVPLRYTPPPPDASGVPVLLVHGFGSDYRLNWESTGWTRALEGLPVFGCDLRGHGGSGKPHDPAAYSLDAFVGDLEALLDALGMARADVVGYSLGARLAWELAVRRPQRVRRAVLAGFGPRDAFAGADLDDPESDTSPFGQVYRAAAALPGGDAAALAACARGQAARPFSAAPAPAGIPALLLAGERDEFADGAEDLARAVGGTALRAPGRDHRTAVAARRLKNAAVDFLGAEAGAPSRTPT
ncbi:alpha/beta fold hydrolase [Streptomonospora salina]|uniref:Pimeloyl-ACP methyl ester carboxylesterase n=1 Tax=Streptomonospora salina TaxID=104205 RepID=A0A841E7Y9_9ACTN|nr:alpha/beta fold hydrolase [Streptomonospora salina]MBB5997238.1 pimeloyl-ACP methyl ester carboxylesterase [Streptomonospora salina]